MIDARYAEPDPGPGGFILGIKAVRFSIEKAYRGAPGKEILIYSTGGMCTNDFKPGQAWLIFASPVNERISALHPAGPSALVSYMCGGSGYWNDQNPDRAFLKQIEENSPVSGIYGGVEKRILDLQKWKVSVEAVASATIVIRGAGVDKELITDHEGRFGVEDIPPGRYEVEAISDGKSIGKQSRLIEQNHCVDIEFSVPITLGDPR